MTKRFVLEDFATNSPVPLNAPTASTAQAAGETVSEEDRLAAFEQGYQSGWDDCAQADIDQAKRIGADLAANLKDTSLTYEQARRDVLISLKPFFAELVGQILPVLAKEALAPVILAELQTAAEKSAGPDAVLIASPAAIGPLETLLETQSDLDISLQSEPAYADGQVSLRYGVERRDINLTDAAERIASAIQDFVRQETQSPDLRAQEQASPTELTG